MLQASELLFIFRGHSKVILYAAMRTAHFTGSLVRMEPTSYPYNQDHPLSPRHSALKKLQDKSRDQLATLY